ncbi:MAG TPA: hypothetical protein VH560_04285 [Polyangia bacterium]|jgi:hypothetical protein|nr:hypothetical protein [Polyangia bacterium]
MGGALVVAALVAACSTNGPVSADDTVYLEGNVYDGAMGAVLPKTKLTSVAVEYRDTPLKVSIDDTGRFVTLDPLPTWQDYVVTIVADGYRPFVSHNLGFDVPPSLASMQSGLAAISTVQSFSFDSYLFPTDLMSPAVSLEIATVDTATGLPAFGQAAGTIRMRPQTQSALEVGAGDGTAGAPRADHRVWTNDDDLLAQTITKDFTAGTVTFAAGELVYGVQYEVTVYGVDGYQPAVLSGASGIVAGAVLSKTITLMKVSQEPLHITANTATMCTPPLPTATTPGAQIQLTFSENVELVGTTYLEDIDNGLSIVEVPAANAFSSCPLNASTDPTKQEHGTSVAVSGMTMTLAFNPSVGIATPSATVICTPPAAITSVTYGDLATIVLQPMGDPSRKRTLAAMLQELSPTNQVGSLSCPMHP